MMKSDKETLSSGELEMVTTILANYSYRGVRTQQTNRPEQTKFGRDHDNLRLMKNIFFNIEANFKFKAKAGNLLQNWA